MHDVRLAQKILELFLAGYNQAGARLFVTSLNFGHDPNIPFKQISFESLLEPNKRHPELVVVFNESNFYTRFTVYKYYLNIW